MSAYTETIRVTAAKKGRVGYPPDQIEAWMRLEHGTLDHLSPARFAAELEIACQCMDASTPEVSRMTRAKLALRRAAAKATEGGQE